VANLVGTTEALCHLREGIRQHTAYPRAVRALTANELFMH